jgi:hypothetical protein
VSAECSLRLITGWWTAQKDGGPGRDRTGETGELQERRLQHREEAERFYRDLAVQRRRVRVEMEASGHARWFERLL